MRYVKQITAGVISILTAALLPSPLGAQPFIDRGVPPWVYVAMQSLTAHGLLVNPPRALQERRLTRGEMAGLVARALVTVTSRQGSNEEGPPVTSQDLLTIRALLREFEAEMASIGVRVEIARITLERLGQEVRRVQISGDARFRYEISQVALNNPGVGPVLPASTQPMLPIVSTRWRLMLDGGVSEALRLKMRLSSFEFAGTTVGLWGGTPPAGHLNSAFSPWNSSGQRGEIDMVYLDWTVTPFEVQFGRLGGNSWVPREGDPLTPLSLTPTRPQLVQFGPIGLLFSTAKDPAGERTLRTYAIDAVTVKYGLARVQAEGVLADVEDLQGAYGSETLYGGRVQVALTPNVVVGLNAVADECNGTGAIDNSALVAALTSLGVGQGLARCSFVWWGAQNGWTSALNTGSTNPYTNVPGAGASADVEAHLGSGLLAQAEGGVWHDPTAQTLGTGWQAQVVIGTPGGRGLVTTVGYQSFDAAFYPPLGAAEDSIVGFIYPGGFQNAFIIVTLPPFDGWVMSAGYEVGTSLGVGPQPGAVGFGGPAFSSAVCERCSPAGQHFSGWLGSLTRKIGPELTLHIYYYGWEFEGAGQANVYRMELGYQF